MGCAVGALAGDLARSDKHTRAVATRKIRDNIELLASLIRDTTQTDKDTARSRAVMAYCALVGAISMARAVSDKELSREILQTVSQCLKNPIWTGVSSSANPFVHHRTPEKGSHQGRNRYVRTSKSGRAELSEGADFPLLMVFASPHRDFCKCEPDPGVHSTEPEQVPTPH